MFYRDDYYGKRASISFIPEHKNSSNEDSLNFRKYQILKIMINTDLKFRDSILIAQINWRRVIFID